MTTPPKVFLSYSHADVHGVAADVLGVLEGLTMLNLIEFWSDRSLRTGDNWERVIESEVKSCDIFVALVDSDWMRSKFIQRVELALLEARMEKPDGPRFYGILAGPCDWRAQPLLARLQLKFVNESVAHVKGVPRGDKMTSVSEELRDLVGEILRARSASAVRSEPQPTTPPSQGTGQKEVPRQHRLVQWQEVDPHELKRFALVRLLSRSLPDGTTLEGFGDCAARSGLDIDITRPVHPLIASDAERFADLLFTKSVHSREPLENLSFERFMVNIGANLSDASRRAWDGMRQAPLPPSWVSEFIPVRGRQDLLHETISADRDAVVRFLFMIFPRDWHVEKFGGQLYREGRATLKSTYISHRQVNLPETLKSTNFERSCIAGFAKYGDVEGFVDGVVKTVANSPADCRPVILLDWREDGPKCDDMVKWKARASSLCAWASELRTSTEALVVHVVAISAPPDRERELYAELKSLVPAYSSEKNGTRCVVHSVEHELDPNAVSDFLNNQKLCEKRHRDDVVKQLQNFTRSYSVTLELLQQAWALHSDGLGGPVDWDSVLREWSEFSKRKGNDR